MNNIKRFEVGRIYYTRSICDHNCIWRVKIVGRTEKTIKWIMLDHCKKVVKIAKPFIYDGKEHFFPLGRYSMAPVISACEVEK